MKMKFDIFGIRFLRFFLFMLCSMNFYGFAQNEIQKLGFKCQNGYLDFYIHKPKSDSNALAQMPLVVVLHGCSQSAHAISLQAGWNELADRYGFMVLYPQQKMLKNPSNCYNWFLKKNIVKDQGEVFCIKQAVDYVKTTYSIDSNRVFVYGVSAGAAMSMALMACYPDQIAGGALLAGIPYFYSDTSKSAMSVLNNLEDFSSEQLADFVKSQNPNYHGKYPKIVVIHGKKDKIVAIDKSYHIIRQWIILNNLNEKDTLVENDFQNCIGLKRKIYLNSEKLPQLYFYEMENLGHAIMVDPGNGSYQGGNIGTFSVDKDFFSTYWIAKDFGLIRE